MPWPRARSTMQAKAAWAAYKPDTTRLVQYVLALVLLVGLLHPGRPI